MATIDTNLPIAPQFQSILNQKMKETHILLKPSDDGILNLFKSNIHFDRSAALGRVALTGVISSDQDLLLQDCPQLGRVSAKRDVVLIRCPNRGKVVAGRDIYCCDFNGDNLSCGGKQIWLIPGENHQPACFSNGSSGTNLTTTSPTIYLVNYTVQNAVFFKDDEGKPFHGKIIMDRKSRIGDLETTKQLADVIILEEIQYHEEGKGQSLSSSEVKEDTPAKENKVLSKRLKTKKAKKKKSQAPKSGEHVSGNKSGMQGLQSQIAGEESILDETE